MKKSYTVTFFYHSCVAVENNSIYCLFDYFPENTHINISFPKEKEIYIFSSHGHGDHFHPEIFTESFLGKSTKTCNYILSEDIQEQMKSNSEGKSILWVKPNQSYEINNIKIKTFGSTDKGVSFLINVNNINIFHSGDLNWWHWDKFTKDEQELERINYQNEIKKIAEHTIDLAFVPVDPRLGAASYLAGNYFIEKIKPKYFVPIHLRFNFEHMKKYAQKVDPTLSQVLTFSHVGEKKELHNL